MRVGTKPAGSARMRMTLPAALLASALLGACAALPPERTPTPPAAERKPDAVPTPEKEQITSARPTPVAPRPGAGVVESASVVALPATMSAAGGDTAEPVEGPTMGYRVRMADGTTQSVVQAGERFAPGDEVEMTADGRLIRR
jgi:hypothetical protein